MALFAHNVDYTDKDFDALRARLIELIRSVFPDWSDFEVAGFGNVLLEMFAFVGDVLGFYLDNQARESRLATATQRKNVIALARMLGYRLHGAQAATANVSFTLSRKPSADVVIPAGSVVRTQEVTEPVRFQLLSDVTFAAGTDTLTQTAIVEHSETRTQRYDTQGLANLDVPLDFTPYLDGSATVTAANGDYAEEESLLGSEPNDRHFMVLVDQNDRATIRFGDGANGAPPTGTVEISYKTGGGADGKVRRQGGLAGGQHVARRFHRHKIDIAGRRNVDRPADKRNEGRRRRQRQSVESEASATEVTDSAAETVNAEAIPAPTEQAAPEVEVASSEALSVAFAEPEADTLEAGEVEAANETAAEAAPAAETDETPVQEQAEPAPVEPAVADEAPATIETEDAVTEEAPEQDVHSTAGVTEAGRAVNDPRVAPKPVTETAVSTELGELFATPEAPPVTVVQQDVSRASNDPRGPRAA